LFAPAGFVVSDGRSPPGACLAVGEAAQAQLVKSRLGSSKLGKGHQLVLMQGAQVRGKLGGIPPADGADNEDKAQYDPKACEQLVVKTRPIHRYSEKVSAGPMLSTGQLGTGSPSSGKRWPHGRQDW
jgi:hypothetical protein